MSLKFPKPKNYRDPKNVKLYGINNPICQVCHKPAQDVHHIIFKGSGGRSVDDRDCNLISLCRPHHDLAHSKDSREWRQIFMDIKNADSY